MQEGLKTSSIHSPSSLTDCSQILARAPEAILWAGGTYLMHRPGFYPPENNLDIIDLSGIQELKKVSRTDRFIEIGCMVNAQKLSDTGRPVLPPLLLKAIDSIGSGVIRRNATIGGALATPDLRLSLPTALAVLDAMAEVKIRRKKGKKTKTSTKWIPVAKIYNKDGTIAWPDRQFLITRVRISLEKNHTQYFMVTGDPVRAPEEAVIVAFRAEQSSSLLGKVRMCITFPLSGFIISQEIIGQLSGISLPITPDLVRFISQNLTKELKRSAPKASPLQVERAERMFRSILHEINTTYLKS